MGTMTWALTGKEKIMKQATNNVAVSSWVLKLFTDNDITPSKDTVVGDLTEDTAAGYAAVTMTPASWTIGAVGSTAEMLASYPQVTFTYTGTSTVYGYYITDTAGTCLMGCANFTAPISIVNEGDGIKVTVTVSLDKPA